MAGLPKVRLHDARHSAATLMLLSGSTLEDVKQTLGHSSIRVTSDLYGGYAPERAERVATRLERLMEEVG
jgi:integrase